MAHEGPMSLLSVLTLLVCRNFWYTTALSHPDLEDLFYPFGRDAGDSLQPPGHDENSYVVLPSSFRFYNTTYSSLYVSVNGMITFGVPTSTWQWLDKPLPVPVPIIAPYWFDVQNSGSNGGQVFYRTSTDSDLLNRANRDIHKRFSSDELQFKARWILIATWYNVIACSGSQEKNTFQAVLVTDGIQSMVMFNYGEMDLISWSYLNQFYRRIVLFNSGDMTNYFKVLDSYDQAPQIVDVENGTNTCKPGRRLFRVDGQIKEANGQCEETEPCEAHQVLNQETGNCTDVAPVFGNPVLKGPVVIKHRWVEFYCDIPTNETRKNAAFNVTFLFSGEPDPKVPSSILKTNKRRATLHERYLTQKHLGKWISCQASSFWLHSAQNMTSRPLRSFNRYWVGIQVTPNALSVYEGDPEPKVLKITSTIPITCGTDNYDTKGKQLCDLKLRIRSTNGILVRKTNSGKCSHVLTESDWKEGEQKAYKIEEGIEVFAKIDLIVSAPRQNILKIEIDKLSKKATNEGELYDNIWSKHALPDVVVYHHDYPQAVCRSTGDPHVTTFDQRWYTIYPSGQFTYVQTTRGTPIEVQLRHNPCGQGVSCVCGVALREQDVILVADVCGSDSLLHFITYNDKLNGAEIRKDSTGRSFEMILPSKVKVQGYDYGRRLTINIHVTAAEFRRTEGLCGSFDRISSNDLTIKGTNKITSSVDEAVESWRIPLGKSLFDGFLSNLTQGVLNDDDRAYCSCSDDNSLCDNSKADTTVAADKANEIVKPKKRFARNTISRGRKRSLDDQSSSLVTDDIDYEYDSSTFSYTDPVPSPDLGNGSWPTRNTISETLARSYCRQKLWDNTTWKGSCERFVNAKDVTAIIEKCVTDIKLTDDLSWAEDKISEIQNLCVFETVTSNITEIEMTIDDILKEIQNISALVCLPQDCSGHGTCKNGTCVCNKGYIGSDCALAEDAIPSINRILGPASCDLDNYPCQKVEFVTSNVTASSKLVCRVDAKKTDNSIESFNTNASMETLRTTSCKLPTKDLQGDLPLLKARIAPDLDNNSEIHTLPQGNPVLHYTISISNDGLHFSRTHPFRVYDSRCFECDNGGCKQKKDTCLIQGYCFAKNEANPLNRYCDICDPSKSSASWTKIPDLNCDPCLSSPCPERSTCQSLSNRKYICSDPTKDMSFVIIIIVTVIAVILTVVVVFLIIRRR